MTIAHSWKDFSSIDHLEIDWGYQPAKALDARSYYRLSSEEVVRLLVNTSQITVRIMTAVNVCDGCLVDLSKGGLGVLLPVHLEPGEKVKLGFLLGSRKITGKGIVKHSERTSEGYKTGIMFVDLEKDKLEFISELHPSLILRK